MTSKKMTRRGLFWLLGLFFFAGTGTWGPVALGAGLPEGHVLSIMLYNNSGSPTIAGGALYIMPGMIIESEGESHPYTMTWVDGNTARLMIDWPWTSFSGAINMTHKPARNTTAVSGKRSISVVPELPPGNYRWGIRAWSSIFEMGPWSEFQAFSVP